MSMKREVTVQTIAGTIATVLGAILLAGLVWFWKKIPDGMAAVWSWFNAAAGWIGGFFAWLGGDVSLARWWYFTLLAAFVVVVVLPLVALIRRWKERTATPPERSFREFTELRFHDVVWRWQWDHRGVPEDVSGYCPRCDRPVVFRKDGYYDPNTDIFCNYCNAVLAKHGGTRSSILRDVVVEIDHAIRHDTWQELTPQP